MRKKLLVFFLVLLLLIRIGYAADEFKPYLHKATVPEHPDVTLFGQYSTNLFPGAAVYSYQIEVPQGTNNLQPSVALSYNSQAVRQLGKQGAGWSLTENYLARNINYTTHDSSDDEFVLVLDTVPYKLKYSTADTLWHTEVESYLRIQNVSGGVNNSGKYWVVTQKDGTQYRFGHNNDSELVSNTQKDYVLRWSLDQVLDTVGNTVTYSYLENHFPHDNGTVYLDQILYNNDARREIKFNYEGSVRPDRRTKFEQSNVVDESRRLTDISTFADGNLVRRYHIDYAMLNPALSSISNIVNYGTDNSSVWYNISFTYYHSTPGYNKSTTEWNPPVLFSDNTHEDYGVRLVDVNNDGFIDILQGRSIASDKFAWINDKRSNWTLDYSWAPPMYIVAGATGKDEGVRFVDVNNDGFTDLVQSQQSGPNVVYLNNGTGWNDSSWTVPIDFIGSNGEDLGVRVVDITADGKADIVKGTSGVRAVYLNIGTGWASSSQWVLPTDFEDGGDTGARLIDVNGDGLVDVLRSNEEGNFKKAWLNNGSSWVNSTLWQPPIFFTDGVGNDKGSRFADINGDGLVDILVDFTNSSDTSKSAWINTGRGWAQNDSWESPEAFTDSGFNIGRRLADVNGDGFTDIIVSHEDSSTQYSWTKNGTVPYLMKKIMNEYGGKTAINYTTSTQFNNSENGTSGLGFNMYVVANVTSFNGLNGSFNVNATVSYNYSFGKYNYDNFEFRGFGLVVEEDSSKIVEHSFYQDDARKGKEYRTKVYGDALFSETVTGYNYTLADGVYNLTVVFVSSYVYDGDVSAKITNTTFLYDQYGNIISTTNEGDISLEGDERTTNYSYALNNDSWIMDRVSSVTVYGEGTVSETKLYYDYLGLNGVSKGLLTKREEWNNNGNNSLTHFSYDSFGNVMRQTDSLGNSVSYTYDGSGPYPVSMVNALGHVTLFGYDVGTGNLLYEEKNGVRTSYIYDIFGRISKEVQPYDNLDFPTKRYNYSFDGVAPEKIVVSLKTTGNTTNNVAYFYDGFAELVQLKTHLKDEEIVKNVMYDSLGRVSSEQNPYLTSYVDGLSNVSSTEEYTYYTYDVLDRVIGIVNPDGTMKNVTFERWNITDFDENTNKHLYSVDAYGRIIAVYEYNTNDVGVSEVYLTTYSYDDNDNLVKIVDNEGNTFSFMYDSLSRKIRMDDPDLGSWKYGYDENGNLITQTDARNETVTLQYDVLNRVVMKNSSDVNISFGYDQDYQGTLSNLSMTAVNMSYEYDDRLRVVQEVMEIGGAEFATSFVYDSQDRVISKGGLSELDFIFNEQGKVEKIPGFITNSSYNAFGNIMNRTNQNNLVQKFTYTPQSNRLTTISIPSVQDLTYTYDSAGNILSINDAVNNKIHSMSYDNLDRLLGANITGDRYVYSYNSIGNIMKIVKNDESKKFVYSGNAPHAPSVVIDGSSGVDVYAPVVNGTNRTRFIEFYVVNDKNTTLTDVNWTIYFGDGSSESGSEPSISDNVLIQTNHTYSSGGHYTIGIEATSSGSNDQQNLTEIFGARAVNLTLSGSTVSNRTFKFGIYNDMSVVARNVSWNCSDDVRSSVGVNLTAGQSLYETISVNYSTAGKKTFTCTTTSLDGSESQSVSFTVKSFEVEKYDTLSKGVNSRVVTFNVKNHFRSAEANISIDGFSTLANISSNEEIMVFSEVNYSSDGDKVITVNVSSTNESTRYFNSFTLDGVMVENYRRTNGSNTTQVIEYDIMNNWLNGVVVWNISTPAHGNSTALASNQSMPVRMQHNYSQGVREVVTLASISSVIDAVYDQFEVRPIEIRSVDTVKNGTNAVTYIIVRNNQEAAQTFSWTLDTGTQNLSGTGSVSDEVTITVSSVFPSSGVYRTLATVNTTTSSDNQTGVIVS